MCSVRLYYGERRDLLCQRVRVKCERIEGCSHRPEQFLVITSVVFTSPLAGDLVARKDLMRFVRVLRVQGAVRVMMAYTAAFLELAENAPL
jgi:hypothetical protein